MVLGHDKVTARAFLAAICAPILVGLLLGAGVLAHRALDRQRLAAWEADWSVTGPHWTSRRWPLAADIAAQLRPSHGRVAGRVAAIDGPARFYRPGLSALGSVVDAAQHEVACEVREGAGPNEPPGESRESRRKG